MSSSRNAPAEPATLREKAYDAFTQSLLANELRAGQFLSQRELVAITKMPLGAIRELIPRLEAEGLIITVPQRGMQIAHVDLKLIRNAFQFRLILEQEATRRFTTEATDAELAELRRQHQDIVDAAEGGVTPEMTEQAEQVDLSLHQTIIDHLDNTIVSEAFRVNWIKVRLIRQTSTSLDEANVVRVMNEHLAVIDALATRSPEAAVEAMTEHIVGARDRALGLK